MRTPSLLGIALLCLSAMPAAMDDGNRNSLKQCDGQRKDWYRTGQYCIRYFSMLYSFDNAESACSRQGPGTHLVSVHDSQTNDDVYSIVTSMFSWTDGSNPNYWNWVPGQPSYTSTVENCVEMNWKIPKRWNDDRCSDQKPFVCAFKRQWGSD